MAAGAFDATLPRYSTKAGAYIARVYAQRNMTARVLITRPAAPDLDSRDGRLTAETLLTVYGGRARVWSVSGPVTMGIGDEPTYYSSTMVSIPLATTSPLYDPAGEVAESPRVDDIVLVEAHSDPLMAHRSFRVVDVGAGGQFPASRVLQCVGIQASKQWGSPDIPTEWIVR